MSRGTVSGNGIVTDGLVLALDAANPRSYVSGSTVWRDLTVNSITGSLVNGPSFNGANGGSIVFDGSNDYTDISQKTLYQFSNTDPYTISAWIKASSQMTNFGHIVAFALTEDKGYYFSVFPTSQLANTNSFLFDYYDGTLARSIVGSNNSIKFDSWIMLTGTSLDNSVNNMKVYQNAVLANSSIRLNQSPVSINYTGVPMRIGNRDTYQYFNGSIAQVMIYNRALSAAEILQNYNATKTRFGL